MRVWQQNLPGWKIDIKSETQAAVEIDAAGVVAVEIPESEAFSTEGE